MGYIADQVLARAQEDGKVPTVNLSDLGGDGSYDTDDLLKMVVHYSTPLEEV